MTSTNAAWLVTLGCPNLAMWILFLTKFTLDIDGLAVHITESDERVLKNLTDESKNKEAVLGPKSNIYLLSKKFPHCRECLRDSK